MPHRIKKLLTDLHLACSEVERFSQGKSIEDYQKDRLLQLALEREFEIIGEALNRLQRIDKARLDWFIPEYQRIIGFRNTIAHGYDIIDDKTVWDLAKNRTPELLSKVENYLNELRA